MKKGTLAALRNRRAVFDELVREFDGHEFGSVGDSLMAEFHSAVNAVSCALAIQERIEETNGAMPSPQHMKLRIGVNLGDVIERGRLRIRGRCQCRRAPAVAGKARRRH